MCDRCQDMVHLHVHSDYSFLDGNARIDRLVDHVSSIGQTAVALTDHGGMFGVIDFYDECKRLEKEFENNPDKSGTRVKPLIGMEGYKAKRTRHDRDKDIDRKPYHILMLAKNNTGYYNLMKLSSLAYHEGFYGRPRIDNELLERYHEGLIVTSGCLASDISQSLLSGQYSKAEDLIRYYRNIFADDFYLEVQYRKNSKDQEAVNKWLLDYGKTHNIDTVVTTDAHYVKQEDADAHDTLLCIQTGAKKSQVDRMRFEEDTFYIADERTILKAFSGREDVVKNTLRVADKMEVNPLTDGYHFPEYTVPDGYTVSSFLRGLTYEGANWRYSEVTAEVKERIEKELEIIGNMGFDSYFLIVWDISEFAAMMNIFKNVRGSGAGSIVCYCLGITDIDPLKLGLYFERFLNPARQTMPDIDIDFDSSKRELIFEYIINKYGEEKVSGIAAFNTLAAKAAILDVARTEDYPDQIRSKVSSEVLTRGANVATMRKSLAENPKMQELYYKSDTARKLIDRVKDIEGSIRQVSTHPAGFIVSDRPVWDYVPTMRVPKKYRDVGLKISTQYPMETCERLGLLKIDILGLKALQIIRLCLEMINDRHNLNLTMSDIPYMETDDPVKNESLKGAFEILSSGLTGGIFQVEGNGLTGLLKMMQPYKFEHLYAAISLFRPGPMGVNAHSNYVYRLHGEQEVDMRHEKMESVLSETFGLIVFQEQIMQLASELFGYEPGEADLIRKAVSKKKEKDLLKHKERFIKRGPENGISAEISEKIFEDIEYFANYGFNKAHAADYAKVGMQTAWLKYHYSIEYFTALMTVYMDVAEKMPRYVYEARVMGIETLPPSIKDSTDVFTIVTQDDGAEAIRMALTAVKHVGVPDAQKIVKSRSMQTSSDVIEHYPWNDVKSNATLNLIRVGAFDEFDSRQKWLRAFESIRKMKKKKKSKKQPESQIFLFDMDSIDSGSVSYNIDEYVENYLEEPDESTLIEWEFELLNMYLTARHTDKFAEEFSRQAAYDVSVLAEFDLEELNNNTLKVAGEISKIRTHIDKNGNEMCFAEVTDYHPGASKIDVVIFGSTWSELDRKPKLKDIVIVNGKLNTSRGQLSMILDKIRFFN